jgi:hypothetical protein
MGGIGTNIMAQEQPLAKTQDPIKKKKIKEERTGGMAQVVVHALVQTPVSPKKKKKEKEKK